MIWRRAPAAALLIALAALAVGCGSPGTNPPGAIDRSERMVKLAFNTGEQFRPVERRLPPNGQSVLPATQALLKGPTKRERARHVQTAIPSGVAVEKLKVSKAGEADVALSPEFLQGVPAEPADRTPAQQQELGARLAQVIYTLTQFEGVRSAKVAVGGTVLDPELTRSDYAKPKKGPQRAKRPKGSPIRGTRQVQRKLAATGYLPPDAVDGLYGYRTQQAVMAFQAWNGLTRDGVIGPQTIARLRKAGRPKPGSGGPSRRIEVYRDKGVTLLVKGDRTLRAIHVSAGAPGTDTPPGTFKIFRKELQSWSVPFETWLPYASYFFQGVAFHEYPDVPPFPASHGCVRVPAPEAQGVYNFAALGTTVVVR